MKLCFLFFLLPMISCSSVKVQKPVPVVKEHWVKVAERPPTYCPRGYDLKAERNFRTGAWVEIGDAADTRYFIPNRALGSLSSQTLIKEAMGARSEMMQQQAQAKLNSSNAKNAGLALLAGPLMSLEKEDERIFFPGRFSNPFSSPTVYKETMAQKRKP